MISIDDAKNTLEFKDYFVIVPKSKFLNWNKKKYMKSHKNCKNCKDNFFYNSKENSKFLTPIEIRKNFKK